MANSKRISSLPLQVVLYFNGWFLVLFYIAEMALLIYKGTYKNQLFFTKPCPLTFSAATSAAYPPGNLAAEVILLLILCLLDIIRIYYGELHKSQILYFVCSEKVGGAHVMCFFVQELKGI